jgi:hypothetical protein
MYTYNLGLGNAKPLPIYLLRMLYAHKENGAERNSRVRPAQMTTPPSERAQSRPAMLMDQLAVLEGSHPSEYRADGQMDMVTQC